MRTTSLDAYNTIKNNGLLSKRRLQVYDHIFNFGPVTCREVVKAIAKTLGESVSVTYSSFSSRFSELKAQGVIKEVGEIVDPETNNTVLLWDVTPSLPSDFKRQLSYKKKLEIAEAILEKNGLMLGYTLELEKALEEIN